MRDVPIPKRLQSRPRYRGLPIPYIAVIRTDGTPDFRAIDEEKRRHVGVHKLCQLCSQPLGRYFFFVGGPECGKALQYFEPPVHLECLLYAMQTCPFIMGKIEHAEVAKVQKANPDLIIKTDETFTTVVSPTWVITKAMDYQFGVTPGRTILFLPRKILGTTAPFVPNQMDPEAWAELEKTLMRANSPTLTNI